MNKGTLIVLLGALLCSAMARADEDPYSAALHVYGCADYPKAFNLFRPLADQGMALAQYQIGLMTEQGQGTEPNLAHAFPWYMKAAEQGVVDAYFALGQLYSRGVAVTRDKVQAYAWFDRAMKGGNAVAGDWLRDEAKKMTPEEIAEAQRIAGEWKPKTGR